MVFSLTIHMFEPTHKRVMHSLSYECHPPNSTNTLIEQTQKILHSFYWCMKLELSTLRYDGLGNDTTIYMLPHPMYMHDMSKTGHSMCARALNYTQPPLISTPPNITGFIEFTICHDRFLTTSIRGKSNKHNQLIQTLRTARWTINPLIIITVNAQRAVHKHSTYKHSKISKYPWRRSKHVWNICIK
jgi:hypothetical protein